MSFPSLGAHIHAVHDAPSLLSTIVKSKGVRADGRTPEDALPLSLTLTDSPSPTVGPTLTVRHGKTHVTMSALVSTSNTLENPLVAIALGDVEEGGEGDDGAPANLLRVLVQPRILPSAAWRPTSVPTSSAPSLEDGLPLDEHVAIVADTVTNVLRDAVSLAAPAATGKRRRREEDGDDADRARVPDRTLVHVLLCVDVHTADGSLLEPVLAGALHLLPQVALPDSLTLAPLPSLTARSFSLVASTLLTDPTAEELAASLGLLCIVVGPSDVLVASSFAPSSTRRATTNVPRTLSPSLLAGAIAAVRG